MSKSYIEVEYRAIAYTAAQTIWLQQLLTNFGYCLCLLVTLYYDNVSTTYLIVNNYDRSKHIDIDYHFVPKIVVHKSLRVCHIPT